MKTIAIIILLFISLTTNTYARDGSVVIINQVRGKESCCQPGTKDLNTGITGNENLNLLPMGWALRFDALKEKDLYPPLSDNQELGLLLEITPDLAKTSGINYRGKPDGSDWYFAKNSLLVGYTQEERKKLIDTLFDSFKKEFGYYSSFTVSWMIDAWSLNYINKTYNVNLHELTKEQYETDSYTLYGGIFNEPYFPSIDHPLLPGTGQNKLNMLIVRQTNSDLIKNYGSAKAYYTSQPNDYFESKEKLDIGYFTGLLDEMINQTSGNNFALIGFENSFAWDKYGSEYLKQLEYLNQYQKEGKIKLSKPSDYYQQFVKNSNENKPFYLKKSFSPQSSFGTLWYFGNDFRARVIIKEGKVILDDLRTFTGIADPYLERPVIMDFAYWVIPYLFDGSQQYNFSANQEKLVKQKDLFYGSTLSDLYTNPFGIVLGEGDFNLLEKDDRVEINFADKKNSVIFNPQEIIINDLKAVYFNTASKIKIESFFVENTEQVFKFNRQLDFLIKKDNEILNLGWLTNNLYVPLFELLKIDSGFILRPKKTINNLELLNPIFQPDRVNLPINPDKSIFYWNNKKAIAGRNPIRLFILPLNTLGRPTKIAKIEIDSPVLDKLKITYPPDYSYRISPYFIDINSAESVDTTLSLSIDGINIMQNQPIEFIADCKKNFTTCLTSGQQALKYMFAILNDWFIKLKTSVSKIWMQSIS